MRLFIVTGELVVGNHDYALALTPSLGFVFDDLGSRRAAGVAFAWLRWTLTVGVRW